MQCDKIQFLIIHPPYMDIVKFTNKKEDLSQISDLSKFIKTFSKVVENGLKYLEKNRYFAIIIRDMYKKSEVILLSFYVIDAIIRELFKKSKKYQNGKDSYSVMNVFEKFLSSLLQIKL